MWFFRFLDGRCACPRYDSDEVRSVEPNFFLFFFLCANWGQLRFIYKLFHDQEDLITMYCARCPLDLQKSELSGAATDAGRQEPQLSRPTSLTAGGPPGVAGHHTDTRPFTQSFLCYTSVGGTELALSVGSQSSFLRQKKCSVLTRPGGPTCPVCGLLCDPGARHLRCKNRRYWKGLPCVWLAMEQPL